MGLCRNYCASILLHPTTSRLTPDVCCISHAVRTSIHSTPRHPPNIPLRRTPLRKAPVRGSPPSAWLARPPKLVPYRVGPSSGRPAPRQRAVRGCVGGVRRKTTPGRARSTKYVSQQTREIAEMGISSPCREGLVAAKPLLAYVSSDASY